jgi:membrane protease YdiL (CAAX protease family)
MDRKPGVIVAVVAWLLAGAGMQLGSWLLGPKPDVLLMVLVSQAAVALPVLILLVPLEPHELGLGGVRWRLLLAGAALGLVALLCSLAIQLATIAIAGQPPRELDINRVVSGLAADHGLLGLILLVAVLAGAAEEALFRGVILTGLRKHLPPAAAVLICALLFATLHLSPWRFLPQLSLGLLLGWLTLRTGSCWPAAVAHAVHNGVLVTIGQLVQSRA